SKTLSRSLFASLALSTLLTAPCAFAAERDGTVFFFSFEELQENLSHPSLPSLSEMPSSFEWQAQYKIGAQESPMERSARWGDGLGIDGYAHPGQRRPLWGY